MAIDNIQGFTGNNSGMGQGLAFVLPESNTEKYAMQLARENAANMQRQAQQRFVNQQKAEQQYQSQLLDQKVPEYWGKAGESINKNYNKWVEDAAAQYAKTGKSPFTDPKFIQRYNDEVVLPARQSKELEKVYVDGLAKVAADDDGKFTEGSKQEFNAWVQGVDKDPISALNKPAPQLKGTPSGVEDFYKLIKPVSVSDNNGVLDIKQPNTSAMMEQAYILSQDPRWNSVKTQYGIDPNLGDIGVSVNKDGKRVWYTNPVATSHLAEDILTNATDPTNAGILQKVGITPEDSFAKERLQQAITKQNAGYGRFISEAGKYGNSLVSPERSRVFTAEDQAMQRRGEQRSIRSDQREETRFNERNIDKKIGSGNVNYNVEGFAPVPTGVGKGASKQPLTVAAEIDAGDIKGAVVPKEIFNTETGNLGKNTSSRNITNAKIRIVPVLTTKNKKGEEVKRILSDDEVRLIKEGKYKGDGKKIPFSDLQYKYMVYGTEKVNEPVMTDDNGKQVPATDGNGNPKTKSVEKKVAFDADNLSDDQFSKKVNRDQVEVKLQPEIQVKILYDRIKSRKPDFTEQEAADAAREYYNNRLQKYQ